MVRVALESLFSSLHVLIYFFRFFNYLWYIERRNKKSVHLNHMILSQHTRHFPLLVQVTKRVIFLFLLIYVTSCHVPFLTVKIAYQTPRVISYLTSHSYYR